MRKLFTTAAALLLIAAGTGTTAAQDSRTAIFAGGCFWCVESDFDHVPGVLGTVSGYTGGHVKNPTYEQVSGGGTGHLESVEITYDPAKATYARLLTAFWHSVDPTDPGGQFCDRGEQYRTAIFVAGAEQRKEAEASKAAAEKALGRKIATQIRDASAFYPAEEYHQDFYRKNPLHYKFYRWNCGRNQRVEELWGASAYEGIREHAK